jgi:hypothetical protein
MNAANRSKHAEMMASGTPQAVAVVSPLTGSRVAGQVRMRHWDKKDRTRRALKFWGACWALALVSVIFPLVHFVLVPGFLLAGPLVAWIVSTQASQVLGGEAKCPDCGASLPISPAADKWPLDDLCAQCHHRLKIEKAG